MVNPFDIQRRAARSPGADDALAGTPDAVRGDPPGCRRRTDIALWIDTRLEDLAAPRPVEPGSAGLDHALLPHRRGVSRPAGRSGDLLGLQEVPRPRRCVTEGIGSSAATPVHVGTDEAHAGAPRHVRRSRSTGDTDLARRAAGVARRIGPLGRRSRGAALLLADPFGNRLGSSAGSPRHGQRHRLGRDVGDPDDRHRRRAADAQARRGAGAGARCRRSAWAPSRRAPCRRATCWRWPGSPGSSPPSGRRTSSRCPHPLPLSRVDVTPRWRRRGVDTASAERRRRPASTMEALTAALAAALTVSRDQGPRPLDEIVCAHLWRRTAARAAMRAARVRAAVLTVSDGVAAGRGARRGTMLAEHAQRRPLRRRRATSSCPTTGSQVAERAVGPDRRRRPGLTRGTGFAPRDVTPEAIAEVVERPTPGLDEGDMAVCATTSPHGLTVPGAAGITGRTLMVNFHCKESLRHASTPSQVTLPHGGCRSSDQQAPVDATAVDARRFVSLVDFGRGCGGCRFAFVGCDPRHEQRPSLSQVVWVTLAMVGAPQPGDRAEPADRRQDRRPQPWRESQGGAGGAAQPRTDDHLLRRRAACCS